MSKLIFANFERCTNCLGCEVACQRENGDMSHIRVVLTEDRFATPLVCRQCDPAPCASVCPTRALASDSSGVRLDPAKCNGCTLCVYACPFGMMDFDKDAKKAAKCDLCAARLADGREPACVVTCPGSALYYGDYEGYAAIGRHRASARILRAQPIKRGDV